MNKQAKIKEYLGWSHKKFREEQDKYCDKNTIKKYCIQYVEDIPEMLTVFFTGLYGLLLTILLVIIFPLGLINNIINWKLYKGSKLNYYLFRRQLKYYQEKYKE